MERDRARRRRAGRQRVIAPETCVGNTVATPPRTARRRADDARAVVVLRHRRARRELGLRVRRTDRELAVLHRRRHRRNHAGLNLQAARVTIDDPVPPAVDPGLPESGFRRPADPIAATATDSAGIRSLRVLVDGVERVAKRETATTGSPRRARRASRTAYDLRGIADGRHTVTTIAEDAASNLTPRRAHRRRRRHAAGDRARAGQRAADRGPARRRPVGRRGRDDRGAQERAGRRSSRSRRRCATAGSTATVPRSMSPSRIGIRVTATDRAGNTRLVAGHVDEPQHAHRRPLPQGPQRARAACRTAGRSIVSGRLTTTDGAPVAHQPIVVTSIAAPDRRDAPAAHDRRDRRHRALPLHRPGRPEPRARDHLSRRPRRPAAHARRVAARRARARRSGPRARSIRGAGRVRFSGRLRPARGRRCRRAARSSCSQARQSGRWTTVEHRARDGPNASWSAPRPVPRQSRAASGCGCGSRARPRCSRTSSATRARSSSASARQQRWREQRLDHGRVEAPRRERVGAGFARRTRRWRRSARRAGRPARARGSARRRRAEVASAGAAETIRSLASATSAGRGSPTSRPTWCSSAASRTASRSSRLRPSVRAAASARSATRAGVGLEPRVARPARRSAPP